ncbi:MAG TPA: HD-GYP domain-containing protein [Dissulfurispiraceae bacterium]|nr:HD-GYP domain-containing protein [Dissulfurispiraceae bacterium]
MTTKYRTIDRRGYIPFASNKLIIGTRLPFDVLMKEGGIFRTLFRSGAEYTKLSQEFLVDRGINELYIVDEDKASLDAYMARGMDDGASVLDSQKAFKDYTFRKEHYHQIEKGMLLSGTSVPFCVFTMKNYAYSLVLHASKDLPAVIDDKVASIPGDVMIQASDLPLYNEYLNSILKSDSIKGTDIERLRAFAIKENSKIIIKGLLEDPRSGAHVKDAQNAVNNMIDSITANKDTIHDLLSLRCFDYYTYTHSVNVAVLSIGLGVAVDMKRDEIEKLGIGALLHDIGKSAVPAGILNKQGKLDDREFLIMQSHVYEGEKLLKNNRRIPAESLTAVTQHHEKISGRGYPARLSEKDIALFGRIAAIADCYDALTTARPYKPAFTPFYALANISKETGNYDPDLLKVFIKMLGKV